MQTANAWKSYRDIATQTAPPGQLILMLFDGALLFLERALAGFEYADPGEKNRTIHNNLQRAGKIIRHLDHCLNLDAGGQLAEGAIGQVTAGGGTLPVPGAMTPLVSGRATILPLASVV